MKTERSWKNNNSDFVMNSNGSISSNTQNGTDLQTISFQDALDVLLRAHSNELNTIRLEMMKKQKNYELELSMAKAEAHSGNELDKSQYELELKKRDEKITELSKKLKECQDNATKLSEKLTKKSDQLNKVVKTYERHKAVWDKWKSSSTKKNEELESLVGTQDGFYNKDTKKTEPSLSYSPPNEETIGSKRPSPNGNEGRETKKIREYEQISRQVHEPMTPTNRIAATLTMDQQVVTSSVSLDKVADTYQESMEILPFYPKEGSSEDPLLDNRASPVKKLVEETQEERVNVEQQQQVKKQQSRKFDRVRFLEPEQSEVVIVPDASPQKRSSVSSSSSTPSTSSSKRSIVPILNMRKKSDRAKMDGVECDECQKFYDALGDDLDRKSHLDKCSKHRVFQPTSSGTPPDFWDMNFPQRD